MSAEVTWDNMRFSLLYQATTNAGGQIFPPFSPPFPSVCHGIEVSLDVTGGNRQWCLGILNVTNIGFTAAISDQNGNPVVGQILGLYYLAFGE